MIVVSALVVAVLWIGGPIGAAQGLGDYLRPTTAKPMPIWGTCTTKEAPPPGMMQVVESERAFLHLTIEKLSVCRSAFAVGQDDTDITRFAGDSEGRWLPVAAGRFRYFQYRRHFASAAAGNDGTGPIVVVADLVQSRWDYLRLNWNRLRPNWFWPYPRTQN